MTPGQTYAVVRARLAALASTLDESAQAAPVPALPDWTVRDTYAHLAGICTDLLEGRLDKVADDEWTAGQVRDRAAMSLAEVCAEWTARGAELDAHLDTPVGERSWLAVQDAWQHEQDIRGALGLEGDRDGETCAWMAGFTLRWLGSRWPEGLAAVRVVAGAADGREWVLGGGEVSLELRADVYTLARMAIGRRSREQILALDWSGDGDPAAVVDALHAFPLPVREIVD